MFSHFLWQMPVYLVGIAKPLMQSALRWAANHVVDSETPENNAFYHIGKISEI